MASPRKCLVKSSDFDQKFIQMPCEKIVDRWIVYALFQARMILRDDKMYQ